MTEIQQTNIAVANFIIGELHKEKPFNLVLDAAKHELILLQKHLNIAFGYVTIITSEKIENLKQAIEDVESCMEVSSESN